MFSFSHFYRWLIWTVLGVALFFSCRFILAWVGYLSLAAQGEGKVTRWEVLDRGARSAVQAAYHFEAGGREYSGVYTFAQDYPNEPMAIGALPELVKTAGIVYYAPEHPERSALERAFPKGLLIRALLCYAILGYFLFLKKKITLSPV